jgi:thioredoxin 1
MSESITEIQKDAFDQQVLNQSQPVIVDFWAPWCGPCKAMAPAFANLSEIYGKQMKFSKCNVDENPSVAQRYGIKSIPTLMIFQEGQPIQSITGMVPLSALEDAIQEALAGESTPAPFIVT